MKFGWGTGLLVPYLEEKICLLREAEITVYFGGTLFEYFYIHDQIEQYAFLAT
ncbi:phosphosulfolactate synthase [Coxiella-like endosymbiont]|uniref:phosphosulfolactate synthase n=1 Tax=Coxiella-like endosymbiont TaxID=1592897 RepID=UPI0034E28D94